MYYRTYIELITFCKYLSIPQLIAYKDAVKEMKNKEFLIALEVLKIRLKTEKYLENDKNTNKLFKNIK
jgi:hypothetical protein|tara:strand:+ start:267 stop:470 length:204 start_codon:yes stop_codon:yes gene_type:complete